MLYNKYGMKLEVHTTENCRADQYGWATVFQCFQQFKEKQWCHDAMAIVFQVLRLYNSYNHCPCARPAIVAKSSPKVFPAPKQWKSDVHFKILLA